MRGVQEFVEKSKLDKLLKRHQRLQDEFFATCRELDEQILKNRKLRAEIEAVKRHLARVQEMRGVDAAKPV